MPDSGDDRKHDSLIHTTIAPTLDLVWTRTDPPNRTCPNLQTIVTTNDLRNLLHALLCESLARVGHLKVDNGLEYCRDSVTKAAKYRLASGGAGLTICSSASVTDYSSPRIQPPRCVKSDHKTILPTFVSRGMLRSTPLKRK